MWSDSWRDGRLAIRTLWASPMFTLTAVLSLAIGIGSTAVIFGLADTYLIRPWPGIADPDRLVEVGRIDMAGPGPDTGDGFSTFSYPNYQDYVARQSVFQSFAASRIGDAVGLGDGTRASRVSGAYVTSNYFSTLGTPIALGRDFVPDDLQLAVPASVAIISHRLWRSQFGGDPDVIGREVQLNGRPFRIIGVAAAGFNGQEIIDTSIWMPLTAFPDGDSQRFGRRGQQWLMGIGRLKDGVTTAQARAEMSRIASDLAREYPEDNRRHGLGVEPAAALPVDGRSSISRFIALFGALTTLVLLIACTNVGGMVLARGVNRAKEMSLRLALGAERARLLRLLMAESVVVAAAGAALGLLVRAHTIGDGEHDLARARTALEEIRAIADAARTAPLQASANLAAGLVALASGDLDASRRELEDAVDGFDASEAPFEAACARLDLASVMDRLGRADAAVSEIDRALTELTRLDARLAMSEAQTMRDRLAASRHSPAPASRDQGGLTPREMDVLRLISSGLSNQAIADRLHISEHTVHRHVANTLTKLDVPSRSAAVAHAAKLGLL